MKKLFLLAVFFLSTLPTLAQTGSTGRFINGLGAARPTCSTNVADQNAHNGDIYNDTDDGNTFKCFNGVWGPLVGVEVATLPNTTLAFNATPSFNGSVNASYSMILTGNVTSSTISGVPINGNLLGFHICQDGAGSHTFVWPVSFLSPTTIQSGASFCTDETFKFDGTNWSQLTQPSSGGGGSGCTSAGVQGTVQEVGVSGGSCAAAPIVDINGAGTELQTSTQQEYKGPNPEVDVQLFGAHPIDVNLGAPASPGIAGACINGNTAISLSGAGATRFQNNDWVDFYLCGPAHSMSTPAAPTVTAAIDLANTNTGFVATNASAGSVNTRCYVIVASDFNQGLTAASPETCVTGGSTILGGQTVNVTSWTRSGQTVTATTSAHTLPIGCSAGSCGSVYIHGTSDEQNFAGWFPLASVSDSTHFTYIGGLSAANGATTSATGGTFEYYNSDHLVLPAFGAGMWQYGIYEGATGAETLVGVSLINVPALVGTPTYNTWDYYGSTYSGNSSLPYYWPSTPPSSPTNDSLSTQIVSGGGTTSLVVSTPPSNTISGTALFDACPAVKAANTFANSFSGGGGTTTFPPSPASPGANWAYLFNTKCSLSGSISQSMIIQLNDTLQFNGEWTGQKNNNYLYGTFTPGAIERLIPINDVRANPGIYFQGSSMRGVSIIPSGNNYIGMFYSYFSGPSIFENMNFGGVQAVDYNGVLFYDFESSPSGAFGWTMNNVTFNAGPSQAGGASFTPIFIVKNNFQYHLNNTPICCRGFFFKALTTGMDMSVDQKSDVQGLTEPLYSFYYTGGSAAGWASFSNVWLDTASQPSFANFAVAALGIQLSITGADGPSSGISLISGYPFNSVVLKDVSVLSSSLGQNVNLHIDGGTTGEQQFDTNVLVANADSLFTLNTVPAAPTCSVATAGPPFTQAFTGSTFQYYPVYFNGGTGTPSPPSNACTTDGVTQQATLTIPTAIPGAIGYNIYKNTFLFGPIAGGCVLPITTTLSTLLGANCAAGNPVVQTGGPAGLKNGQVWGDFFPIAPNNTANALPSYSGGKLIATPCVPSTAGSLCDWNGANWALFTGNITNQSIFEESAAGVPLWEVRPLGNLVGTGQSNTWTTGVQDFSGVTAFRPKSGLTSALPATCSGPTPMDVYLATDAQLGRNWYFCTASNVWTQQVNTGDLGLNTYSSSHTLLATESWANFSATATATIPHLLTLNKWVVYNTSASSVITLAPDSGNITLNGVTAVTATVAAGLGVEVTCDGTNCFAWGIGGSSGGSGTVGSCSVNGVAYYSAATTTTCVTPLTAPNGVPATVTQTASGGVSQPPTVSLPGIVGRAVSGIAATDTILSTDCNPNRVEYIGSVAVAVTLPTAVTLGVPNCTYKLVNTTVPPQTVTITPTTWTINGGATLQLFFGQQLWVYKDPNSATNWVADQTDLAGNVSGAAVPASAKLTGTNSSSQITAAALANTHIYVGNGSNLPADVAAGGDVSLANTGAFTVLGANGGTFPASAAVLGTNSSKQPVAATAHAIVLPWECADTSGSGSAQVCNTSPTFTPTAGDTIIYTTTTANTGAALTVNVNSLGAKPVAKWQTSTTLVANDIRANTQVLLSYDGTNWELTTIGNAPSGGGQNPCTTTALSIQYNNGGNFGCLTEFTYASSTITSSSTGKIDLTSASVTAGFHLPSAAGAAPTNGGIISYDQTCNKLVVGNATNTSSPSWITSAATNGSLAQFSGTCGLLVSTTTLPSVTVATTQTAGDNTTSVATDAFVTTAVSNAIAAVNPAVAVLAATIGSNLTGTYSNGASGIGATFTITATGAFTLDGVAINTIGQRVLLKDQTSGFQNGIYTATVVGTTGVSPVFTRALDYDQPSDINTTGAVPVQSGTVNAESSWLLTSTVNTVGTDALTYAAFTPPFANIVTQNSNASSGQICTYTGANKICVPATALPNGVAATTQSAASNDTKVATDAYADAAVGPTKICAPNSFASQTDGATVTWAIASAFCANASLTFTVHSGSRTLNITGPVNGGSYVIWLKQDATGGEGLTLGTGCTWKVKGGGAGAVTLTNAANAIDILAFTYDGTNCYANLGANYN